MNIDEENLASNASSWHSSPWGMKNALDMNSYGGWGGYDTYYTKGHMRPALLYQDT